MSHFKDWLREAMGEVGLTVGALAKAIGVDSSTVSNWLSGHRRPKDEDLRGIARVLNVPQWYVFYQAGIMTELPEVDGQPADPRRLSVWREIRDMPDEELMESLIYMRARRAAYKRRGLLDRKRKRESQTAEHAAISLK